MPEEQNKISFGQYLNSRRLEAGLDLDYISEETKIGKDTLQAIEEENHDKLPEPVYVMGFIRSFASVVGADQDWAVRDYSRNHELFVDLRQSEFELGMKRSSFRPRILLWAVILIGIAAAVYFGVSFYRNYLGSTADDNSSKAIQEAEGEQPSSVLNEKPAPEIVSNSGPKTALENSAEIVGTLENADEMVAENVLPPTDKSGYDLKIEASEQTWIKIMVDGSQTRQYTLNPGEGVRVQAESKYNILIGNAAGVKLNLNGKPVQVPGKSGQVVNIELP